MAAHDVDGLVNLSALGGGQLGDVAVDSRREVEGADLVALGEGELAGRGRQCGGGLALGSRRCEGLAGVWRRAG